MLIKTKGAIPNNFLHALQDILRLTSENELLQKITKDYSHVKKIVDENEQVKSSPKTRKRKT
jgi:hypothetical protein